MNEFMNDPYEVLGLTPGADEAVIRDRYLALVREFPPDRDPGKFTQVRAAYEQLRDPLIALKARLFPDERPPSPNALEKPRDVDIRERRLPTDLLLQLAEK